ncbi:MAG TPA: hypothetical protein VGO58_17865, partial [Chitinophagaceae bacterium]|nr:hypothetical protein [Chitinophagaceae bacterium]
TFRFGYLLEYDSSYSYSVILGGHTITQTDKIRLVLKKVTPYTKTEKQQGYQFGYLGYLPEFGAPADTIQNSRDYWGYYNGADNGDSLLPNIPPYSWGADRTPDEVFAGYGMLTMFRLPTGGYIQYGYQLNDHYPYTKGDSSRSLSLHSSTTNNITLNQVFNNRHQLVFLLDRSVSRTGSAPVSGSGNLNLYLKSTDGVTTYLSTTISLYDLFYSGMRSWTFNLPNGTYRLETSLSAGTSVSVSLPSTVNWETKTYDNSVAFNKAGGVRVGSVMRIIDDYGEGGYEQYKYITADGKSSGFLGNIPRYDYPYSYINGGTTTDYTAVTSEPLANTEVASVGYSRVEVIRQGAFGGNLGKEVTEFTDLGDVNTNVNSTSFPYTPQDIRSWGLGIPKRMLVYDSSGNLVKKTVNTIQVDTTGSLGNDFKGLKLGHAASKYNGPGSVSKIFIGDDYYITSGRAYVTASFDTMYQANGSINTSYQYLTYDTNYNVTKVKTSYDRNRSLEKETRMYYPYNYTVGGGIGKLRDSAVISQMVATETWIIDAGTPSNNRITGAAMTSFRSIGSGDVKPDTIYSLVSNKPIVQATITSFDPAKLNRNTTYFKPQSYFTSYESKGNLSEVKSLVSGLSNSVITDYDQQYAIAKVSDAVQADIAYTSFESKGTGNWIVDGGARDLTQSLTGKKSYSMASGDISKSGLTSGKHYLLTIWVKSGSGTPTVNGTSLSGPIATQNSWNLYSVALTGITLVTISGTGTIDELRLHPKDANMETYAYEPLIGVISGVDANNTVVYTEYDKLNRVKLIRDKDKNIIKRFDYSDTTMLVNTAPQWVGFERQCSSTTAAVDSAYRDMNIFSDSSGYVKWIYQGYLDCSCSGISSLPQYKVVNGVCEMGVWSVTSSVYGKYSDVFQYRCTWKYCFSDYSTSTYFEYTYNPTACTITCGGSVE